MNAQENAKNTPFSHTSKKVLSDENQKEKAKSKKKDASKKKIIRIKTI